MRRLFFKTMAVMLMLSLAAGVPRGDALQVSRLELKREIATVDARDVALLLDKAIEANRGEYYGSHPAGDVFVTQTVKHTCTLVAATMMLRNYACQRGTAYEQMTSSVVSRYCWTKKYGLSQSFSIGELEVACSPEIRNCSDKKQYLIDQLKIHPEGVVIYDTGAPHAIWLFGYDEDTDIFWVADTIRSKGGKGIPLVESIIKGETQQDKVDTIDKIWYVKKEEYQV